MDSSSFDFELPEELIAQQPSVRRDGSRLMVVDRQSGQIRHMAFHEIPDLLSPEDLLVLNNTKVFPARLAASAGERVAEVFLVRQLAVDTWEALIRPGRRVSVGQRLVFSAGAFEASILEGETDPPIKLIRFDYEGDFWKWIDLLGQVPLPPYIRRKSSDPVGDDRSRYQTIFARERGSVAAPTAGLHFTGRLLEQIPHCFVTLHIGYGTFKPVRTRRIEDHRMDPEFYRIGVDEASRIQAHINSGGRVVAVGSTTTRVLEHVWSRKKRVTAGQGFTELFIYPGFQFHVISGLVTNFHLPGSTLLLLVAAFAGRELLLECYRKAVECKYRFYSYGDAMLLR